MIVNGKDCLCDCCGRAFRRIAGRRGKYCSQRCYHDAHTTPALSKFLSGFTSDPNSGCWIWGEYIYSNGYGAVWVNNRRELAHRFSYRYFNNRNIDGLYVLHKCDNPACVNPDHLDVGTQTDNMRDAVQKGRVANGATFRRSSLTDEKVRAARAAGIGPTEFALANNIAVSSAHCALVGKTWKHVK